MAQFFVLLATVALLGASSISAQSKPKLLTLEQQQELLEQLAQLQRQTQQLLAAQQSLAAVAAAAGVSNSAPATVAPRQQDAMSQLTPKQSLVLESLATRGAPNNQVLLPNKPKQVAPKPAPKPAPVTSPAPQTVASQPALPQGPQINWGKCPELEPSESEKLSKAGVITKCLENTPLPGNITRESVEQHREQIAACALRAEGWFANSGGYDYSKAEKEIKNKRLQKDLEMQVLSYHAQCKAESEEKYPSSNSSIIAQIQLYQACMDYFISDVCGIEVNEPEASGSQFN